MDVKFAMLRAQDSQSSGGGHIRWSYRFGLRLGLDLVGAVVVLCVLFMALEPRARGIASVLVMAKVSLLRQV